MGTGLLLSAAGCADLAGQADPGSLNEPGDKPRSDTELRSSKTSLLRAEDCPDLLTKIQDDAIAKLDLVVSQQKESLTQGGPGGVAGGSVDAGTTQPGLGVPNAGGAPPGNGGVAGGGGFEGPVATPGGTGSGTGSSDNAGNPVPSTPGRDEGEPIGSSDTNTQVEGVDEADFVKLVESGKGMFLLHGSSLRKLKTFPAEELSLEALDLKIEGTPSELFVTDAGQAVIFSSVWGYGHPPADVVSGGYCTPSWCGGGGSFTKITVADVSGATPQAVREIYYRGNYVSSRRHGDVVRVVLQSYSTYADLYTPSVEWTDAWGRPYEREQVEEQLDQWRERTAESVRDTTLGDWLPVVQEVKDGTLVDVEPTCNSYFVPQPGISEYGLTHVLSIDVSDPDAAVGGVTVLGQASTVYASLDRLVLAQPDYRWLSGRNFGFVDEQRTTLHMFGLEPAETAYLASGWVTGHLPPHNAQFGLDVTADHTLRVATTGSVRTNPAAMPEDADFWSETVENRVYTLRQKAEELSVVGRSENLGHYENNETIHSARFVGDRSYVVTFRNTDPLIVLDVATAESPTVLGQIEIPGFSQYMHPLDENHLITFGQSGTGGSQLQLFDVTNPASIPEPKLLDLGQSWSELANNHKAFTFYAPQSLIALPISGNFFEANAGYYRPTAGLKVVQVDADSGFELLGSIDHSSLYEQQKCVVCDGVKGCYVPCGAPVEVRRGHFVEGADGTYVYAISYGGVSVSDLADLSTAITTVVLPQPLYDSGSWHGTDGGGSIGGASSGGGQGGIVGGGWVAPPGMTEPGVASPVDASVAPIPSDPGVAVDAGIDEPAESDGGSSL